MPITPVTTTSAEAAKTILEAHAKDRLTAQLKGAPASYFERKLPDGNWLGNETYETRQKLIEAAIAEDDFYCCAIGQLFPPEDAARLQHGNETAGYKMAQDLINESLLNVPPEETDWFVQAQVLHDTWSRTRYTLNTEEAARESEVAGAEQDFLNHIKSAL